MIDLQTVNVNVSRVPFFRFLNFEVQSLDSLHADAEMTFASPHIGNPIMEHYHGGIIASFMEATAAISVHPDFADVPAKPINLTVDYLRPGVKGPMYARANVTRKGKRIASVAVMTWQTDREKPVAEGLYHFLLV
ncbi:PaaI family thioesterase [Roseobacter litoralis]|uniref:PaaI family thioesterase n=1 Tax=Roseobacter litoralis TaxID=42443 RepID=UPI0024949BDF|nr:PaaI family thioesterase [Roseobacter litoralis]